MPKPKGFKEIKGYYRPQNTNPNWYDIWTDYLDQIPADEVLDEICKIACGVEIGAADEIQRHTKHIHACLIAAYKVGKKQALQKGQVVRVVLKRFFPRRCKKCSKNLLGREVQGNRIWWSPCNCEHIPGPVDYPRLLSKDRIEALESEEGK